MSKKKTKHDYKTIAYICLITQAALVVVALFITLVFLAPNDFKETYTDYKDCINSLTQANPSASSELQAQQCPKPVLK